MWIYARDCSSPSLKKFSLRSIYGYLFPPWLSRFSGLSHVQFRQGSSGSPGFVYYNSLHKDRNNGCSYVTKENQADNRKTQPHRWHMEEYNASLLTVNETEDEKLHWLQTSLKCLICWFARQCLLGFIQCNKHNSSFIQWTDNSGSKFLFIVTEKEQLWNLKFFQDNF